jgi:hypothetical protein
VPLREPALRVIDECGRQSIHLADAFGNLAIAKHDRVVDEHAIGELHDLLGILEFHRDAYDLEIFARLFDRHQVRYFFQAGRTPGCPEIHDQPFAPVTGKTVRLALGVGQREIVSSARCSRPGQYQDKKRAADVF